ncbi:lytic transglycosylase domain-containing protein [Sphingomonas gei]|uniref:Lytic transglycosylase domain-containing protein n=1 Tax=Sphingomonas gei TaxID=1395960 RepID=A0A4S1XI87_9SPHN|nr:lytic transglycosylase domain-containing protein [Sphingomonas gei]TGX55828.1 lytic transglycosylase domain-containing protein [Sphingomonas gei]
MGTLRSLALAASLVLACPAGAQTVSAWRPFSIEASQRFGVPVAWIERVMQAESGGRTRFGGRPIVSRAGAMGLMQLMPGTWAEMRAALGLGSDPFDPRDNILAGTAYLRRMYDRFGYPGLFAAYNAGPGRYAAYLAGRQSLPDETVGYLAAVTSGRPAVLAASIERRPTIFVSLGNLSGAGQTAPSRPDALFAVRRSDTRIP